MNLLLWVGKFSVLVGWIFRAFLFGLDSSLFLFTSLQKCTMHHHVMVSDGIILWNSTSVYCKEYYSINVVHFQKPGTGHSETLNMRNT